MSKIPSATTVSVTAYLTSVGRSIFLSYDKSGVQKRFSYDSNGNLIDNFEITQFSIYDSDTNYKSNQPLGNGDLPALSGIKNKDLNNTINLITRDKNKIVK